MRRQFDVEIAFGTFSVVVVGAAAAAAPSPYRALSGRNVVDTTSTPECSIRRSSFRRSEAQNVSKETNISLMLVLGLSSNHPRCVLRSSLKSSPRSPTCPNATKARNECVSKRNDDARRDSSTFFSSRARAASNTETPSRVRDCSV